MQRDCDNSLKNGGNPPYKTMSYSSKSFSCAANYTLMARFSRQDTRTLHKATVMVRF